MKKGQFLGMSEEGFHKVAYTEWGEANHMNPPIICVHGLTRNGRDFDVLADFLAKQGRHVYCPDIVGRGDSDHLINPMHYSYEQYLEDMNAMIARMQAPQIDWIGTSMGGLIGMIIASMSNSPIRCLVMNDVGAQVPAKAISRLSQYIGKDPDFTNLEEATLYFKSIYSDFGKLTDAQWRALTENSVKEVSPGRFVIKIDHGIKQMPAKSKLIWNLLLNPLKALEGSLFDVDLWQFWRNVTCPVLIIHGKQSDLLTPDIIDKMLRTHKNTEVIEIEDAGHAPALLNHVEIEMIYRWLAKIK